MEDPLVARLAAAGCVFAAEEAGEIRRVLGDDEPAALRVARQREQGRPLEQALGLARFGGVDVAVDEGVFVPRRRAAVLVDAVLALTPTPCVVVDLGCGSGAIAAAIMARLPRAQVHAADREAAAIACARRNGERFGFSVHAGDWWRALPSTLHGRVDAAVAYLPHVPTDEVDLIPRDFRDHEPRGAVDGGADGLDPLRAVLAHAGEWLADGGALVTLLGADQLERALSVTAGWTATSRRSEDDSDGDAVLMVRRSGAAESV